MQCHASAPDVASSDLTKISLVTFSYNLNLAGPIMPLISSFLPLAHSQRLSRELHLEEAVCHISQSLAALPYCTKGSLLWLIQ